MGNSFYKYFFISIFGAFLFLSSCQQNEVTLIDYSNESFDFSLQYPSEYWEILNEEDSFITLKRSSYDEAKGDDLDAIVLIYAIPSEDVIHNNPREFLLEYLQTDKQSVCPDKKIYDYDKVHPFYSAATTCIDVSYEPIIGDVYKVDPVELPAEMTVLMDSEHIVTVTYSHFETSPEIHRDEVETIISSITFEH